MNRIMSDTELKAQVYVRLRQLGYKAQMNVRLPLYSSVKGYKVIVVDVLVRDRDDNILALFYIGRMKARKEIKYKMLKIKIFFILNEDNMNNMIRLFNEYAAKRFYK